MAEKANVALCGNLSDSGFGWCGQMLIQMLQDHPWFHLKALIAESEDQAGRRYGEVLKQWWPEEPMPAGVADMVLLAPTGEALRQAGDIDLVISSLLPWVSKELDPRFAAAGFPVVSESPGLRDESDIPLVVPEINPDHLEILPDQQRNRGWDGYIVSNPVCTITVLTLAMKPIEDRYGIANSIITTLQALSGAGPTGIPSLAVVDNLIPYITKEEEKLRDEGGKILGRVEAGRIVPHPGQISSTCTRVGVSDGHTGAVSLQLREAADLADVKRTLADFRGLAQELALPTAPERPIYFTDAIDRPQPRLDRMAEGGMSVTVGRLREEPVLDNGIKFVVAGHNKIRGTAGNTLMNAELLYATGRLGLKRPAAATR